jgi:DNA primase
VDVSKISEENPKYRFPSVRDHGGNRYEFDKSKLLYNAHEIPAPVEELTIVSNFPSVWWLWQHRYVNTVALMGSSCSPVQAELIVGMVPRSGRIRIFTDGTKVGTYCGDEVLRLVAPYRYSRRVVLANDRKPTDCDESELRGFLT